MLTDEQREERRGGLGASDAPSVFNVGFGDQFSLWVDKLWGTPNRPTARMRRGSDLEPLIAAKAADKLGLRNLQPGGWVDHPDHDWMFANLDATTEDGAVVVECKAVEHRDKGHEWGHDDDPEGCALHVELQALHQLETTGAERLFVAVLFVDTWELRTYPIKPDRDIQGRMVDGEHAFWTNHVIAQLPPPITKPDAAWDAIRQIDEKPDSSVDLPGGMHDLIARYVTARSERLDLVKHETALRAEIARAMGDNQIGRIGDQVAVTFRKPSTGEGSRRLVIPTPYRKSIPDGN